MSEWHVEEEGEAFGLKYVCVATPMGHRYGYIALPQGHAFWGLHYSDPHPLLLKEDLDGQEVGERGVISVFIQGLKEGNDNPAPGFVCPDVYFNVHGSITFSKDGAYPLEEDHGYWWWGFDCGHAGDAPDPALQSEEVRNSHARVRELLGHDIFEEGVVRDLGYVRMQCFKLCEQLQKFNQHLLLPTLGDSSQTSI